MTGRRAFRNEELLRGLEAAITGNTRALYEGLARVSGLPGERANMGLVAAFADECAARGSASDKLLFEMAQMDADRAPGGSPLEILPMCGVEGLGARAAADQKMATRALAVLHDASEDLRFRVRERVPPAIARIGAAHDAALDAIAHWMDGYFHAAAALTALADASMLARTKDPQRPLGLLHAGFELAKHAPRAAARYPGFKSLLESLARTPAALAARYGGAALDEVAIWAKDKDPTLRDLAVSAVSETRLVKRFPDEVALVLQLARAAGPAPRDPGKEVRATRQRGKRHM